MFLPCGFFFCLSFFFSWPNLSRRRLDVCHTSTWCGLSANLGCRSETCCRRLAANTGRKKSLKICHLSTIAQLCQAISLQIRHVSTIGKKLVKQRYLLHISPQYGELWPTSGWDRSGSFGHPSKFQRVSCLDSVTTRHSIVGVSQTLRCWTESATYIGHGGSLWALAHILAHSAFTVKLCNPANPAAVTISGQNTYAMHILVVSQVVCHSNKATTKSKTYWH